MQYILGSVFVLVAIGGTIVLVRNIQNGSLTGLQGGVLMSLFMAHIHGFQHDVLFKQCGRLDLFGKHWADLVRGTLALAFSTRDWAKKTPSKRQRLIIHIFFRQTPKPS